MKSAADGAIPFAEPPGSFPHGQHRERMFYRTDESVSALGRAETRQRKQATSRRQRRRLGSYRTRADQPTESLLRQPVPASIKALLAARHVRVEQVDLCTD